MAATFAMWWGDVMVDVVSAEKRSRMMSGIRGKNTRPEITVRRFLHQSGFRFRLHSKNLAGRPDLVLSKWEAVVFVNGCFWHRHKGCRLATNPGTRVQFWEEKFKGTVQRDFRNLNSLEKSGWRIAVIWECGLRGQNTQETLDRLEVWLRGRQKERLDIPVIT